MGYLTGGMLGRAAGRGIKSGAKYAAGAAALGTGAFLRQAASPIPGGTAAMTAGLGLAGAVGGAAYGKGFGGGGKDKKEGGSGAGGAISSGMDKLGESINKLADPLKVIEANSNTIKDILLEMRNKAYEDARNSLKNIQGPPTAALAAQQANSTSGPQAIPKKSLFARMIASFIALGSFMAGLRKSFRKNVGNAFRRLGRFFGPKGPIGTRLAKLGTLIAESKLGKFVGSIFGKNGAIANRFTALKDSMKLVKGNLVTKFTNIFGKGGAIATRLTALKAAAMGGAGQPGVLTKVADGAKNLFKGGVDKVKTFGKNVKSGAIDIFTKGLQKIKNILQGVKDIGAKIIKFVTANPLFSKIGAIAKTFGALLGRIFYPILVLWSLFEGVMGAKDSVEEEGKKADSDIFTKVIAGLGGFVGGVIGFLVGGLLDLGKDLGLWLMKKLGFKETAAKVEAFFDKHGGFTGMIKSAIAAVYNIPINIWKWLKGMLGFGDAESDAGKSGAGFIDKFKSTLAQAYTKLMELIPNMDDIPALAMSIMGDIKAWFGKQLVGIGKFMNGGIFGDNKLGNFFIKEGEKMISGGEAASAAGSAQVAQNKESRRKSQIEADTGVAQGNAAATSQSVMTEGFGGGSSVTNVNNNSYGAGSDSDGFSIAPVPAARESFNRKDRYAVARGSMGSSMDY